MIQLGYTDQILYIESRGHTIIYHAKGSVSVMQRKGSLKAPRKSSRRALL